MNTNIQDRVAFYTSDLTDAFTEFEVPSTNIKFNMYEKIYLQVEQRPIYSVNLVYS